MDLSLTFADGVALLTMDDGKVNVMDRAFLSSLEEQLDASQEASAVVICGRSGTFSAGLDMNVLADLDPEGLVDLMCTFGRTMLRVWEEPRPVVGAITGHAVAGGTILAMACDHAVAAGGDFRWGLTETAMGFPVANWMLAIARGNVSADRLDDLVLPGKVIDPAAAVEVGFADEVVPPMRVVETALTRAQELAALPRRTYAYTKSSLRGEVVRRARSCLEGDVRAVLAARSEVTPAR